MQLKNKLSRFEKVCVNLNNFLWVIAMKMIYLFPLEAQGLVEVKKCLLTGKSLIKNQNKLSFSKILIIKLILYESNLFVISNFDVIYQFPHIKVILQP